MLSKFLLLVAVGIGTTALCQADPVTLKVVGPDDKPQAGAEVFLSAGKDNLSVKTDPTGSITWDLYTPKADANSYGMATVYMPGLAIGSTTLNKGENTIHLGKPVQIQGSVTDPQGHPIAGTKVKLNYLSNRVVKNGKNPNYVWLPDALKEKLAAGTDAQGNWIIKDLPANATLDVSLDDPKYVKEDPHFVVGANGLTSAPLIARPGATVTGRVVYEDGKPASDMQISIQLSAPHRSSGWGGIPTQADGSYRLGGLTSGTVSVSVLDPHNQWAAVPVTGLKVKEGETIQAGDLVLTPGAVIEGTISDKDTGAPLPDIYLYLAEHEGTARMSSRTSVASDKEGHYKLRVAPGKTLLQVNGALGQLPKGYLSLEDDIEVTTVKGETKDVPIQLKRGLTVSGMAVDTTGVPAAGAHLYLMMQRELGNGFWSGRNLDSISDAQGQWSMEGVRPGQATVGVHDRSEWEVVSPKEISLPAAGPLKITLRKLEVLPLKGRVLTPQGKPIAGAALRMSACTKSGNNGTSCGVEQMESDEQGTVETPKVRADAEVTVTPTASEYKYVSGGTVTRQGNNLVMSDLMLLPFEAQVEGTIRDEHGTPVAGAKVLSPDGNVQMEALSDATGHFTLKGLPEGEATLLVGYKAQFASVRATSGAKPMEIRLLPLKAAPGPDLQRGYNLLQKLWEAGPRGVNERDPQKYEQLKELWGGSESGQSNRRTIPLSLLPGYPDLALKIAQEAGAPPADVVLSQLITSLVNSDPVRAVEWAPAKFALYEDAKNTLYPKLALAMAALDIKPELARSLYPEVRDLMLAQIAAHPENNYSSGSFYISLAKLATQLHLDEAAQWREKVVARIKADGQNAADLISSLIALAPDDAPKLLTELPERERANVLGRAAAELARWDLPTALKLMAQMELETKRVVVGRDGSLPYYMFISVIKALSRKQPDAALALAHQIKTSQYQAQALLAALPYQNKDVALSVIHEIVEAQDQSYNPSTFGYEAALAYEIDPQWGLELLERDKARALQMQQLQGGFSYQGAELASVAYYYSRVDPAASRLMLESLFARQLPHLKDKHDIFSQPNGVLADIATAMAAIDLDRALEMASQLEMGSYSQKGVRYGPSPHFLALRQIANYMVTPEDARRTLPFKQWNAAANY